MVDDGHQADQIGYHPPANRWTNRGGQHDYAYPGNVQLQASTHLGLKPSSYLA